MSNPYFQFKQFTIRHDRCAMKVGTDGVLLGAWSDLPAEGRVLDIGTGTGLVALMVAQRNNVLEITGIDIDSEAVLQARENVEASPFASRVSIQNTGLEDFCSDPFDAIVCNPPFFEETLLPPDAQRRDARHTCSLPFSLLASRASDLLKDNGTLSVIVPTSVVQSFQSLCEAEGLRLSRLCYVRTTVCKQPKRTLATFRKCSAASALQPIVEELVLQDGQQRTAAYAALTSPFYLH